MTSWKPVPRCGRAFALCAAILLGAAPAHAQTTAGDSVRAPRPAAAAAIGEGPLLDAPVSRTDYRLGAGDVLNVALFGDVAEVHAAQVSPEGTVVVPGMGSTRVLGLNVEQAEDRIRALVGRYYRNVEVAVSLARVRTFKVFVVGDVPNAGVRIASATTRVSELLPNFGAGAVRRRNITLRRAAGETVPVDLVRFTQAGDLSANPFMREGDALVVPTLDETVLVLGRVHFPAAYEFRQGESLAQLLSVVNGGGGFPSSAADSLRISRVEGGAQRTVTFSRADALGAEGQRFLLRPSDAIFVPEMANFRVQRFATIEGQVARPGTYPIRPDTTTVRDLVAMAGGLTPLASLPLATLRRQPVPITRAEEQLQKLPPDLLGNEERGIMEARAVTDVSIVSLDLRTLVAEGRNAFDQTLRAHDVLTIPERRDEVTVAGAVIRPGILTYVEGQSARDYVVRAGWVSRRADAGGTVVIRAQSGARISANEAHTVDPGDTIVVPFRRRRDLAATVQIVTGVASTILGLALTAVALF